MRPRLIFAGTPDFAVPTLHALLQADYSVVAVYTQPDRPAGRGRALRASPVKIQALAARLPVYQPATLRDPTVQAELAALQPDLLVVAAYGLLLPPPVLALPRFGCINVHASLLPRWRGAAPVHWALLAGDPETGISIMHMDAGLDTGPVLNQAVCPIPPGLTGGALHDQLATLGAATLLATLPEWLTGRVQPVAQDSTHASYAPKLSKADLELDWRRSAWDLERQVLAFHPHPVARTALDGQLLRIWRAQAESAQSNADPGWVLRETPEGIWVAAGTGTLRLTEVQLPGGRPLPVRSFLNAHRLAGRRLGMA